MTRFLILSFLIFSFFFYIDISNNFFEQFLNQKNLFLYFFIFLFLINLIFIKNISKFNFNLDIFYKFYHLFLKNPSFFLNYIINILKKIYLFFIHIKYWKEFKIFSNIFKKLYFNFFVFWRPLFKKFSYFGYFRSNRSKWIK